jgi:hypothetical protein
MAPHCLFITYVSNGLTNEAIKTPPILVDTDSEAKATLAAKAVADFAFSQFPFDVLVQVMGDDPAGHPITEIRRPPSISSPTGRAGHGRRGRG